MNRWTMVALAGCLVAGAVRAEPITDGVYDPYFIGFEAEPAMDYGGRDIATLQSALCRGIGWALPTDRLSYLAPAYEFILAGGLSVVQHEVMGHGSRAREFDLNPDYGFGLDFSGWTSVGKAPESNLQNIVLDAGGMEGDSIMAHRILRDLYTGGGADGSKIPLMALGKIDFSLYCFETPNPTRSPNDFTDEANSGNDVASYIISRQAQRRHADPADVWNNNYPIDFTDRLLGKTYDQLQEAAIWNLADPAALAAMYSYVVDHAIGGHTQVRPPVVPLGGGFGLTAGTRAFAGPEEVTRFLDLYFVTPGPLFTVYGRDLQGVADQTYGWGAGLYGAPVPLLTGVTFGLAGDVWQVPESPEGLYDGSGWNAVGEVDALLFGRWGVSGKVGAKSRGYFPGTPMESGAYGGAGLLVAF